MSIPEKNNFCQKSKCLTMPVLCQICLQPFVQPLDTPCGHTFCHVCMHNYLKVNPMCPLDRKPLNEMTCSPSNLVLKR